MTVAEWIVKFLAEREVTHVFEVSGGMITRLLDAAHRNGAPKLVSMRHEQAAGFAAEGWARMTGIPGVAMATSGPGALNLLGPLASCYFDSVPAVFLTGQVPRNEQRSFDQRQKGFQETDIATVARSIAKWTGAPLDAELVAPMMRLLFEDALGKRPGPCLLDLTFDLQHERLEDFEPSQAWTDAHPLVPDPRVEDVNEALATLREAERPLVLVGGGVRACGAHRLMKSLLERLWVPVVHSLMAVDVLNSDHPLRVGLIGSYGNRYANMALDACDALLVLGSRLDIRQTGANVNGFVAGKRIIHVDVDAAEDRVPARRIRTSLPQFAQAVLHHPTAPVNGAGISALFPWRAQIGEWKKTWPDTSEQTVRGLHPNAFMHALGHASKEHAAAYVVDVGQHQMWAAQSLPIWGQRFLTSGGLGAMGFALPAAIGACIAAKRPVVMIAGDGGFQVNMQELQTIREHELPIKMIVMNNHGHGMVRQFQDAYFEKRYVSTEPSVPEFDRIARAYSIDARWVMAESDVEDALEWLWSEPSKPSLLEVDIDAAAAAVPKLAFGKGLGEMEPKR